jgi:hypothetical protein
MAYTVCETCSAVVADAEIHKVWHRRLNLPDETDRDRDCPRCGAAPLAPCLSSAGQVLADVHHSRRVA